MSATAQTWVAILTAVAAVALIVIGAIQGKSEIITLGVGLLVGGAAPSSVAVAKQQIGGSGGEGQ